MPELTIAKPKIRKITITTFKDEIAITKNARIPLISCSQAKVIDNIRNSTDTMASSQAAKVSPVSRRKQQNFACMLSLSMVIAFTFSFYKIKSTGATLFTVYSVHWITEPKQMKSIKINQIINIIHARGLNLIFDFDVWGFPWVELKRKEFWEEDWRKKEE